MLNDATVLTKTHAGRDAVARRSHGLNPRQRALLISINGELSAAQLRQRFGAAQQEEVAEAMGLLLREGLIEAQAPAEPTAVDAGAPVPDAKNFTVARAAGEPVPPAQPPDANADHSPVTRTSDASVAFAQSAGLDWRALQSRASGLLHDLMGPDADLLAMRLERARSEREFVDHLERSFAVVESAHGETAAVRFRLGVLAA